MREAHNLVVGASGVVAHNEETRGVFGQVLFLVLRVVLAPGVFFHLQLLVVVVVVVVQTQGQRGRTRKRNARKKKVGILWLVEIRISNLYWYLHPISYLSEPGHKFDDNLFGERFSERQEVSEVLPHQRLAMRELNSTQRKWKRRRHTKLKEAKAKTRARKALASMTGNMPERFFC